MALLQNMMAAKQAHVRDVWTFPGYAELHIAGESPFGNKIR